MKIAFIGGGNMGEAIIAALLKKKLATPADISVSDISETRRRYLEKQYGVAVTERSKEAVNGKDIIILAVKPQNLPEVMTDLKGNLQFSQLVFSIVAGIKIETISQGMAHDRIVRVMPNTPAQIGLGFAGWTATPAVNPEQRESSKNILNAMGKEIYFDDEKYLDMVTAVSGSGPAYVFLFAETLIEAAVNIGLSREDARKMVLQTMSGSAELMQKSGKSPTELIQNVASKGGTTARALGVFEEAGLKKIVSDAVKAAYDRAKELGS
jgi:pyrroline-5-carboxylate reductase